MLLTRHLRSLVYAFLSFALDLAPFNAALGASETSLPNLTPEEQAWIESDPVYF